MDTRHVLLPALATLLAGLLITTPAAAKKPTLFDSCTIAADAVSRNPGASNPDSYTVTDPNYCFTAQVNLGGTTGHTNAMVLAYSTPITFPLSGGQVLLINVADPGGQFFTLGPLCGPLATWTVIVPGCPGLCGATVYTQAVHFGGGQPFALSNAQDLTFGI